MEIMYTNQSAISIGTDVYLSFPDQSAREVRTKLHDKDQTQRQLSLSETIHGDISPETSSRKRDSLDISSRLHV